MSRDRTKASSPRRSVFALSIAMMILAGDPHTAANVLLLAVCVVAFQTACTRDWHAAREQLTWWLAATVLVIAISAVQWMPSLMWSMQSHRWLGSRGSLASEQVVAPESPQFCFAEIASQIERMLAEPSGRTSQGVYDFSLSPWHGLTCIWPTLGGNYTPTNTRIFSFIASEGRMWIPSLFFGCVPLMLLFRGKDEKDPIDLWLTLAIGFAMMAALGNYSLGWLIRNGLLAVGAKDVGGNVACGSLLKPLRSDGGVGAGVWFDALPGEVEHSSDRWLCIVSSEATESDAGL